MSETMKRHVTGMGYSVVLTEEGKGSYLVSRGGRPIRKGDGTPKTYRRLDSALDRFYREVGDVEGWEARLRERGLFHPVVLCAGGCGTEMRATERRYSDGRVVTADEVAREPRWCVSCGFRRRAEGREEACTA